MGCGASKKADATAVAVPVQSKPSDDSKNRDNVIPAATPFNNAPSTSVGQPTTRAEDEVKTAHSAPVPKPASVPQSTSSPERTQQKPAGLIETTPVKDEGNPSAPSPKVESKVPAGPGSSKSSNPEPAVHQVSLHVDGHRSLPVLPFRQCPSVVTWYTVSRQTKPLPRAYSAKQALVVATSSLSQSYGSLPSVVSWLPQTKTLPSAAPSKPAPVEEPVSMPSQNPQSFGSLPSVVSWNQVRPAPAQAKEQSVQVATEIVAQTAKSESEIAKPELAGAFSSMPSVVTWQLPASHTAVKTAPSADACEPTASKAGGVKHTLILIRHGESQWNVENRFTGWVDVPLAPTGEAESHRAASAILEEKLTCDVVYSSVLKRAIKTGMNILEDMDLMHVPMIKDWRLNERHYGALQGLNKSETVAEHGEEKVNVWRRSYDTPPPDMAEDHEYWSGNDKRYSTLQTDELPKAESLKTVVDRFMPLWSETLAPAIQSGKKVMVAAHGNTLRALVKHLDNIPEDVIAKLNIPTAVPLIYELDENLKPVRSSRSWDPLSGYYLGDQEQIAAAINGVAAQSQANKE